MKRILFNWIVTGLVIVSVLHAGKNSSRADSPVVPVTTIPLYIGIGGVWSMTSTDCPCAAGKRLYDSSNFGGIVRIGYDFNPFFGIEARALKSKYSKKFAETTHYGLYLKPQYHISNAINVYALAGYGHTRIDSTCKTPLYEKNGFSFGAGMEYDFASADGQGDAEEGWGMFADYQNLLLDKGINKIRSNIFTIGVTYDF
jgi:opacity protein-like surface antigen